MNSTNGVVTSKPKVTVCVVTYNQEKYITECLNSIVEQVTDFTFEVLVADDCSSDKTRNIILDFQNKFPHLIFPIFHEKNIGAFKNGVYVQSKAKGQYVAHIDGDDYILPGKLQTQVDCLDSNPNVSFAAHAVREVGSKKIIGNSPLYPELGTIYDILNLGTYFVHSSVMFRKEWEFDHPDDFETVDFYLHVERASKGDVYLDKRVFGCYRSHEEGISTMTEFKKKIENFYFQSFERAIELGIPEAVVTSAYLKRKKSFAYARYFSKDHSGYKEMIALSKGEMKFASTLHIFLHLTKAVPVFMWLFDRLRKTKSYVKNKILSK
jgi:glycosyltransferase involved in cell wall biosynthesis